MQEPLFLRQKFQEFYKQNFIEEPPDIHTREFGMGEYGRKIVRRHMAFADFNELNDFLRSQVPFYISFSGAYYRFPEKSPMNAKSYLQSDLFFEFDADDLKTDCKSEHDSWQCACGAFGQGALENCPQCGARVTVDEWVCPDCLKETARQTEELISALETDFGFSDGLSINFSGHKGYHLHVRGEAIRKLNHQARIELVDYLTAHNLNLAALGFQAQKKWVCPFPQEAKGWSKKILDALRAFFQDAGPEELSVASGVSLKHAREILEKKDQILNGMRKGVLYQLRTPAQTNKFWQKIFEDLVDREKLFLDRQTSIDVRKILRLPESLHGGTGLKAINVEREQLKGFDPLKEAVVFQGKPLTVAIKKTPRFYINGEYFGPFEGENVELPEAAAVYLLAKQKASLVEKV